MILNLKTFPAEPGVFTETCHRSGETQQLLSEGGIQTPEGLVSTALTKKILHTPIHTE